MTDLRNQYKLLFLLIISIAIAHLSPLNITLGNTRLFRLDWFIGFLLIFIVFSYFFTSKNNLKLDSGGKLLFISFFISIITIGNLFNLDVLHLKEFSTVALQFAFVVLLYLAVTNLRLRRKNYFALVRIWLSVGSLVAIYGIYQTFARNLDLPLAYIGTMTGGYGSSGLGGYIRPSSFFVEPSSFGSFLMVPAILALTLFIYPRKKISNEFNAKRMLLLFFLMLVGIILSYSLTAYLVLAGTVAFMLIEGTCRRA